MTAWLDEPDRGYNLVKICTWDRAGLFSKIAGSLSAAGLNILSAQIFTRTDGIALDTVFVNDARTGNLGAREQHDQFAGLLEKVLNGEDIDLPGLIARQITSRPVYQAYAGRTHGRRKSSSTTRFPKRARSSRLKPRTGSACFTPSRRRSPNWRWTSPGARIVTERGAAIDSFYVRELGGGKIISAERQKLIETRLREAIKRLDAAQPRQLK